MAARIINSSKSLPVIIPFVVLSAWSGSVYLQRRRRHVLETFLQGSMDEIIMDSLQTGDVIGFRHQHWMNVQPLTAAVHFVKKQVFKTNFDQLGVVVVDKLGQRFILEHSTGLQLYSRRILSSDADEIVAFPVQDPPTSEMQHLAVEFAQNYGQKSLLVKIQEYFKSVSEKGILLNPDEMVIRDLYQHIGFHSNRKDPVPIRLS